MSFSFKCRQVDKYDGQTIFANGKIVYDLGNYLGGGASGSVYQAVDPSWQDGDKSVAIKILNPLNYKNLVFGNMSQFPVALKGAPLSAEQAHGKLPMAIENVWWLLHTATKVLFAAFEDPQRKQLRELPLTKCVEIWGTNPLNFERLSDTEVDKINFCGSVVNVDNKEYRLPLVPPKFLKFLRNRQQVCREMNNMVRIGEHPNIVELVEVLELVQDAKTTLFLVLELVNGGELFDRVKAGINASNVEVFARRYFNQLLSGLEYCHKRGVVHRDLKPENLLLSDPSEHANLKIADFGLSAVIFAAEGGGPVDMDTMSARAQAKLETPKESRKPVSLLHSSFATPTKSVPPPPADLSPSSLRRLKSVVGSPHYIAPEIASDDPAGYDGCKVDMWSTGVILYSLFTSSLPFGSELAVCSRYKRYKQWLNNEYATAVRENKEFSLPSWFWPTNISPLVSSLLVGLLQCDPNLRLSAAEALRHPWCQGLSLDEYKAIVAASSVPLSVSASIVPPQSSGARTASISTVDSSSSLPSLGSAMRKSMALGLTAPSPLPAHTFASRLHGDALIGTPEREERGVPSQMPASVFRYDWALIQEQQRQKEAEALEIYSRQVGSLRLSGERPLQDEQQSSWRSRRSSPNLDS